MTRTLIVFYSRTGTTRQAAQQLQQLTQWPMAEIRDLHERAGFWGDLRCVFDSLFTRATPYQFDGPELGDFDRVVLFTPIWMRILASPMRAYLREQFSKPKARSLQVSLVCVMGGQGAFNAAAEVATLAGKSPLPMIALRQSEVLSGACIKPLQALADSVQTLDGAPDAARPMWLSPEAA